MQTAEQRAIEFKERWRGRTGWKDEMDKADIAEVIQQAMDDVKDRCIDLIRQYLLFNSQRAVSWHEVQDVITAIREQVKT